MNTTVVEPTIFATHRKATAARSRVRGFDIDASLAGVGVLHLDMDSAIALADALRGAIDAGLWGGQLVADEDFRGCERMPLLHPGDVEGWACGTRGAQWSA